MKKISSMMLLSASIGLIATVSVGSAIAYEPHCHDAYNRFWKKIHTPKKLDHKPSKETVRKWTAYNEAMLKKLDFACERIDSGYALLDKPISVNSIDNSLIFPSNLFGDRNSLPLEQEENTAKEMIQEKEYPLYDSPSVPLESNTPSYPVGYGGGWGGWFSGGGYNPNHPQTPPSGGLPSTPIAPTPEPLTFGLVMVGAAFVIVRKKK